MKKNYESPLTEVISIQHKESVLATSILFLDALLGTSDVEWSNDEVIDTWGTL